MGSVFKQAVKQNIVSVNPLSDIKRPKSNQELVPVRALTIQEQKHLIEVLLNTDVQYSEIMLLSLYTGMRIGEICALSVEDVNFSDNTVFIHKTVSRGSYGKTMISNLPKNGRSRTLPIDPDIVALLKLCIGDCKKGFIFESSNGNIITTNQVNSVYANILKNYDIIDDSVFGKVDLHSLRHTYATRSIEAGVPASVIQKLLGHSDISITLNVYCSVFDKFCNEHLTKAKEYMTRNKITIGCHIGCQVQ